jgi:RNA methyltransferase, TrmH family
MAQLKRSSGSAGSAGSSAGPGAARLLTLVRDLQRRRGRERRSLFVAEGVRTVEEVVRSRVRLRGALVTPQLEESPRGRSLLQAVEQRSDEIARVSARELAALSDTDTPQGVLAVAEIPSHSLAELALPSSTTIVILDGVQDPGNAGTILRTAAALGSAAVLALPGTVDLWNPKVVRGAMGAHFHVPVLQCEPGELSAWLNAHGVQLWATDAAGEPLEALELPDRVALAVGNEGAGVSASIRASADRRVALRLAAGVESLNVAVATGIMLYVLRQRRSVD